MINGEKFKHLSDENRMEIQNGLNTGCTFKQIGRRIGKDPTTVSKEVKKHIEVRPAKDAQNTVLCETLIKAPFVCNGCKKVHYCKKERHVYVARKAHAEYKELLSDARTGIMVRDGILFRIAAIRSNSCLVMPGRMWTVLFSMSFLLPQAFLSVMPYLL